MKAAWLGLVLLAGAGVMRGQAAGCPLAAANGDAGKKCVYFTMERFGVEVGAYTIVVRGDGQAMYWETANLYGGAPGQMPWLPVGAETVKTVFAAESVVRGGACSSHVTNLPMGGKKKLVSWNGGGKVECAFSRSGDATVSAAEAAFEAMAETLQAGARLTREHLHERLALEPELDALAQKVHDGKAIEVQMIAPALQALIDDDLVVEVVKKKAGELLKG
ncbi:MAG: hypothetical protein V4555_13205 [Acidobacteriota bacterium]